MYLKIRLICATADETNQRLYSATSQPFDPPKSGKIAVKVINHYGDEVAEGVPSEERSGGVYLILPEAACLDILSEEFLQRVRARTENVAMETLRKLLNDQSAD